MTSATEITKSTFESPPAGGLKAQPAEYERRVVDFFDQALLGR